MITVEVQGQEDLAARLDAARMKLRLKAGLERASIKLQRYVVSQKLSGQVLNNRTGTLRRSINQRVQEDGDTLAGFVGSFAGYVNPKGNQFAASYARIHEYGGTFQVPAHERKTGINAKGGRTKMFNKSGGVLKNVVDYKSGMVKAHTVTFKERSFLRSSLREQREEIIKEIRTGMIDSIKRGI